MSPIVHVANTDVEFEFSHHSIQRIDASWSRHPLCLQLQFLPLLYANPEDWVAVTAMPPAEYLEGLQQLEWWKQGLPRLVFLENCPPNPGSECISWGPSRQVQAWADAQQFHYSIPRDWEMVRLVNSKIFSFRYSTLSKAALVHNEKELHEWVNSFKGPKVLKTCFGLSGQGNRRIDENVMTPELKNFCEREWQQNRPLVAEPWLERLFDFSTQWMIHQNKSIKLIGTTKFETDAFGRYQGTCAGPEDVLFDADKPFLEAHKEAALKALREMATMGFFGHVGVDALVYHCRETRSQCLYPIVEINGRQTMSLIALRLQRRHCPEACLRLSFVPKPSQFPLLLPNKLTTANGKPVLFHRNLTLTIC